MSGKQPVSKSRNHAESRRAPDATAVTEEKAPWPLTINPDDDPARKLTERLGVQVEDIEIVRQGRSGVEVASVKGTLPYKKKQSKKRPQNSNLSDEEIILICKKVLMDFVQINDNAPTDESFIVLLQRDIADYTKNNLSYELLPHFFQLVDLWEDKENARKLYVLLTIIFRLARRIGVLDPDSRAKKLLTLPARARLNESKAAREGQKLMQPFVEKASARLSNLTEKRRRREVKKHLLNDDEFKKTFPPKNVSKRTIKSDIDVVMESLLRPKDDEGSDCRVIDLGVSDQGDWMFAYRLEPGRW
jgi:hypothetical protein